MIPHVRDENVARESFNQLNPCHSRINLRASYFMLQASSLKLGCGSLIGKKMQFALGRDDHL